MLNAADLAWMRQNTLEVMSDHQVSIVIRRGETPSTQQTLSAQSVRVERMGTGASKKDGAHSEESRTRILVVGGIDLNIAVNDRFNTLGGLYRVVFIRPNTQVDTQAEAELIE